MYTKSIREQIHVRKLVSNVHVCEATLYPRCGVTYDPLVRFHTYWGEYFRARAHIHLHTQRETAHWIPRYWKPSNWYEKLKRFAKSAEIWQPYSPGLVHQILLQKTGPAIVPRSFAMHVERAVQPLAEPGTRDITRIFKSATQDGHNAVNRGCQSYLAGIW